MTSKEQLCLVYTSIMLEQLVQLIEAHQLKVDPFRPCMRRTVGLPGPPVPASL